MSSKWLIKSESSVYSIDDLKRDRKTLWVGVRNYQARNYMRDSWQVGDELLYYHSVDEPIGVAGLATVLRVGVPDPSQFDRKSDYFDSKATSGTPRWWSPEIGFVEKFSKVLTIRELREIPQLKSMVLLKQGSRLSVQPVTVSEFKAILRGS